MASSKKTHKAAPKKKQADRSKQGQDLMAFLTRSTGSSLDRIYKTAKVGIVTALVGGIFKAMALTNTFPPPFDTLGNVVLFVSFLMIFFSFLFYWFSV